MNVNKGPENINNSQKVFKVRTCPFVHEKKTICHKNKLSSHAYPLDKRISNYCGFAEN